MNISKSKLMTLIRAGAVSSLLLVGLIGAGPVAAQGTEQPPVVAQTEAEEEDEGFDDWGLLGLLGLAGLAGLMKKPDREVRTVDRGGDVRR